MFNLAQWWKDREKKTDDRRADGRPEKTRSKKTARSSRGTSKASREQKRQKRARMITRRIQA